MACGNGAYYLSYGLLERGLLVGHTDVRAGIQKRVYVAAILRESANGSEVNKHIAGMVISGCQLAWALLPRVQPGSAHCKVTIARHCILQIYRLQPFMELMLMGHMHPAAQQTPATSPALRNRRPVITHCGVIASQQQKEGLALCQWCTAAWALFIDSVS
jgi:hypothetical protein